MTLTLTGGIFGGAVVFAPGPGTPLAPPGQPTGLAVVGTPTSGSAALTWTAPGSGGTGFTGSGTTVLGPFGSGTGPVSIHEIVLASASIATLQMQQIEGYLAWRHGIALGAGHPYVAAAPTL